MGAIGLPLLVAIIWAMLGSPNAPYKLQGIYGSILEIGIFTVTSFLLYSLGHTYLALIYWIVAIGISTAIHLMGI